MSEQLSKLKLKDTEHGKVLTVDENGVPVSSSKNVIDLVTKEVTNALEERISNIEGNLEEAVGKVQDING